MSRIIIPEDARSAIDDMPELTEYSTDQQTGTLLKILSIIADANPGTVERLINGAICRMLAGLIGACTLGMTALKFEHVMLEEVEQLRNDIANGKIQLEEEKVEEKDGRLLN